VSGTDGPGARSGAGPSTGPAASRPAVRRRRWLIAIPLVIAVGGYIGAALYMRANETAFVFHPDQYGGRAMVAAAENLPVEAVRIPTPDSLTLSAWVIPPVPTTEESPLWVLFLHGNAANISVPLRQAWIRPMRALGVGLVLVDYRGYGASDDGLLTEEGLYRDARATFDWLTTTRGIDPSHVVIFGHSLGSGVATHLAARVGAAGLVLEGAFTSIPDVGAGRYPWLPIRWLARERFASLDRADSIAMPKLLLHAEDDGAIPFAMGQQLFAALQAPKSFATLTGGHDRAFAADSATYFGALREWLATLRVIDRESPPPG
jgi:pimeloyl-ACP methyl ester carboxylesterase